MFSRTTRIGAVLLALAQLCVWGFVAPAHRLLHHTHLATVKCELAVAHPVKCCSHHRHGHCHAPVPSAACPKPPSDSPEQCPDDDAHCGLCLIACQAGHVTEAVQFSHTPVCVGALVSIAACAACSEAPCPFDSRGPPTV